MKMKTFKVVTDAYAKIVDTRTTCSIEVQVTTWGGYCATLSIPFPKDTSDAILTEIARNHGLILSEGKRTRT